MSTPVSTDTGPVQRAPKSDGMRDKYKETLKGGLAVNVVEC